MIVLLSGVSGTGKTWLRTRHTQLSQLPCVDIADIYDDLPDADWWQATNALIAKTHKLLKDHPTVLVEGYFLPGTESRKMLANSFLGHQSQEIFLHASRDVCAQRIRDSGHDVKRRLELLDARWEYANRIHKREQNDEGTQ